MRVLLLYDEDRTLPGLAVLDASLRSNFRAGLEADIEFFTESMNVSQFNNEHYEEVLSQYYSEKYRDIKLDLIVGVMGPALGFLLRHGNAAFPGAPVVFCGADAADIQGVTLRKHMTGLLLQRVFAPTLDIALRLQPEIRHVVVVGGSSTFDRHLQEQAQREFQAFEDRLSFEYLTEQPVDAILASVSRLPPQSIVVYLTLFRDASGRSYVPHDVASWISNAANAPVYIFMDQYLGRGPVGGHLYSIEQLGKSTADLGLRILRGESPETIPVRALSSTANMFDARQLARWHLDEHRLPADSIVRFREPTVWDRYKRYIESAAAVLIAQSLLIAGLLIQRTRRRRAEAELRSSYERIRDLGGRLLNAQESERAHLARELHDDISQQMVALQFELQTLMSRGGEESLQENESLMAQTRQRALAITRSLRDLSHWLHPAHLRLLGLTGALADLQRELSTSEVAIAFSHESVPDSLPPDVMLCFYRVAQEALRNAVQHSRADIVSVQLHGSPGGITMVIADNGIGFDVHAAQRGLGLISMSERVEQIGGRLDVLSAPGAGTQLEVRVPCIVEGIVEAEPPSMVKVRRVGK